MTNDDLSDCPHCAARPAYQTVPQGDPAGFGGRMYIECTNKRCGASTSISPGGLSDAQASDFLAFRWNARVDGTAPKSSGPPKFPVMLRKQWSGTEVQDWIDANWRASA